MYSWHRVEYSTYDICHFTINILNIFGKLLSTCLVLISLLILIDYINIHHDTPQFGYINASKLFSTDYIQLLDELDLCESAHDLLPKPAIYTASPVFVSAWSANHHAEAYHLLQSFKVYSRLEYKKLIVYNLGINESDVHEYERIFGALVEFRMFNFSKYPVWMAKVNEKRWKPIVIADVMRTYPVVWWLDASLNFVENGNASFENLANVMRSMPATIDFAIFRSTGHSIYAATHPKMYDYLPIATDIAKDIEMFGDHHMLWYSTKFAKQRLMKWFVWCALERDCMGPVGYRQKCNEDATDTFFVYANCHREDQSAINIIAATVSNYHTDRYRFDARFVPLVEIRREKHD